MQRREQEPPRAVALKVPTVPDGFVVLSNAILSGSRLAIVGAQARIRTVPRRHRDVAHHGELIIPPGALGKIWVFDGENLIDSLEFPDPEPLQFVDQFPDGRWLIAGQSAPRRGRARVFSVDGVLRRSFELGDDINHLKIDDAGRIWVGWSDPGVFGNEHWRLPGLPHPPSASGLAAFDDYGQLLQHGIPHEMICCYALNVSEDAAWACTHVGFPIKHMSGKAERGWSGGLNCAQAMAVSYPHVLAVGGYTGERDRALLFRLDDQVATTVGQWLLPFGKDPDDPVYLVDGREDEVHVFQGNAWLRWRVRDFINLR